MRKLAIKLSGRNGSVNTVFAPVLSAGETHDRTIRGGGLVPAGIRREDTAGQPDARTV